MRKTILFVDIDSTIVENKFSLKAMGKLLGEIAEATGLAIETLGRELWLENSRRQKETPNDPLTMDWDDIVETIARRYDVTLSGKVIDLWQAMANPDDVDVLDNAPQVMQALKAPHRRLIIATKGLSKYQRVVLETVEMHDLFDDILTPDITGYLKTQPDYFNTYTQSGEQTLFIQIGDHHYDDVICAKRNGFYSVMRVPIAELLPIAPFDRPAHLSRYKDQISTYRETAPMVLPDAVVVSLEEVPGIVAKIEAENQ